MTRAFRELLAYREIILILIWRDLKTRYRGSVLGFLWTFLNPLLLMVIYSLVFSVYMRVDIHAYPIFLFAGLLPWIWFSSAMLSGAGSIVESGNLIKRVPFPPHILPAVSVTATLINFLLALPLLVAFMVAWGFPLGWSLVTLPLTIAVQYVFTLGLAIVMSMLLDLRCRSVRCNCADAMPAGLPARSTILILSDATSPAFNARETCTTSRSRASTWAATTSVGRSGFVVYTLAFVPIR